eukprot:scaffold260410_cov22-Tisochrysis_lutea.AAC.3
MLLNCIAVASNDDKQHTSKARKRPMWHESTSCSAPPGQHLKVGAHVGMNTAPVLLLCFWGQM